ncbi:hypothetical protein M513_05301 [Trichuris suis]|uniref:Uncharacterized protein n=1 Tax=Trichuris suis TaxID=68888 RepID=A0A085M999_9BILA|nr:hypothetical protein M513_05301 [Trichuris suis]
MRGIIASVTLVIFASKFAYCDETIDGATVNTTAQRVVEKLSTYFNSIYRCPVEPIILVAAFKHPHHVHEGDACTLGSVSQPQRSPESFLTCEQTNDTIYVRLGDIYDTARAVRSLAAGQESERMNAEMNSLIDFVKFAVVELTKAAVRGIPVPVPRLLPGYERCGKYVLKKCPENKSFNFLKQQCLNETMMVSGLRLFVSLAQTAPLEPKGALYSPRIQACMLGLLPDMVQYVLSTGGQRREQWKGIVQQVRKAGNDSAHAVRLLTIAVRDFVNASRLHLEEHDKTYKVYASGSSLLGLLDILTGNRQPYTVNVQYVKHLFKGISSITPSSCPKTVTPDDAFTYMAADMVDQLER